jgi:hypothetical protein
MHSRLEVPGPGRRRAASVALAWIALVSLSAGCSAPPVIVAPPQATIRPAIAASQAPAETVSPPVVAMAAPAERLAEPDPVEAVLVYANRLNGVEIAERAREIVRLGDPSAPDDQLRLAILLSQMRQPGDLINTQQLLLRVLANPSPQARPLQPLARLLLSRFLDQRRVEDLLERQSQQLRELQSRLDQTRGKLDALKEIERSLNKRPSGP